MKRPAVIGLMAVLIAFTGCQKDLVHQRSISELNSKAQQMMQMGDTAGAVARLEAARDLNPEEPSLLFNLAVAYKENKQLDQSVAAFEEFLKRFEGDPTYPKALQSYAIVLEDQADALVGKALDAVESEDSIAVKEHTDAAVTAYERAIKAFRLTQKEGLDKKYNDRVLAHIHQLEERLAEVKVGKLDPLGEPISMNGEEAQPNPDMAMDGAE